MKRKAERRLLSSLNKNKGTTMQRKKAVRWATLAAVLVLLGLSSGCEGEGDNDIPSSDDDDEQNVDDDDDNDDDDDQESPEDGDTEQPQVGDVRTDDAGIEWVFLPAGEYQMGCSPRDEACVSDEYPVHTVTLSGFWMMRAEATQTQYLQQTGENPSTFAGCDACPVETVTHAQALAFCQTLDGTLPSESQWEYAARAETDTIRYCGDDEACLADIAWYDDNSEGQTQPVGQLDANGFGLFDILGNVWEWTADCYVPSFADAPTDGNPVLSEGCSKRVARGGSWYLYARRIRVTNRLEQPADEAGDFLGVRCVKAEWK